MTCNTGRAVAPSQTITAVPTDLDDNCDNGFSLATTSHHQYYRVGRGHFLLGAGAGDKHDEGDERLVARGITVKTNKDRVNPAESNDPPAFDTTGVRHSGTLEVDENTPSGRNVGARCECDRCRPQLRLTYRLEGRDAALVHHRQ